MEGSKNTEETEEFLYMRGLYNGKHEHTPVRSDSVIRIQKLESNLGLKFRDCARFCVRRWQCQAQGQGNSVECFEEGRLAALRYQNVQYQPVQLQHKAGRRLI